MGGLKLLAEQLLLDYIISNHLPFPGKNKFGLGLMALSGFFIFLGLGFLVFAAHLWLQQNYQPDLAAAMTGGLALGLAFLAALTAFLMARFKQSRLSKVRKELKEHLHSALEFLNEELTDPVENHPAAAVALASLAGFLAGKKLM